MSSATISPSPRASMALGAAPAAPGSPRLGRRRGSRNSKPGNLNRAELFAWAARYPEEVPPVNGELPWIGLRLADLD